MIYLTYVMFLFAGHNDLSLATRADSWGAAQPRATLDYGATHGHRGGGSCGVGDLRGAGVFRGGGWVAV
jgi:hypothetical protein